MQPQDAGTGDLDISAGSRLLDCPRLWPEPAHTYSGWSLSSWAAAAISSAGRGFSAFLHLSLTSFLLGWAGGWGVQGPPVPSACQGGDALSEPDGRQRGCFPRPLDSSLQQGLGAGRLSTARPSSRRTASRLLLPLGSCCPSLPHGDEQANPCPAAGCQSCSHPLETCRPGCPDREGRCCSQRCQSLPVPGVAVGPPLQTRLPTLPILPWLALAALASGASLAPTLQTAARPPGGDGNAAAGRISLSSWRGFLRL